MIGSGGVALVTGGASGIGAAACRRLAGLGLRVAVADLDEARGKEIAAEIDGSFVALDVTDLAANHRAVADTEAEFGRLDVAFLNAGVVSGVDDTEPLDPASYRRIMAVNVDGVVYGVDAALPALRRTGGGAIVATASLAGLVPMPGDALYTLTKAAVVGYVRALAPSLQPFGVTINALCPGFADTPIIGPMKERFIAAGFPVLSAGQVGDVFIDCIQGGQTGQAWFVQPGLPPAPYAFRGVPAARTADGEHVGVPAGLDPHGNKR
ncbi:SDR family oxidoreductase [soil metagenome]